MTGKRTALLTLAVLLHTWPAAGQTEMPPTSFRVKYVSNQVIYLEGGKSDGLAVGMNLRIKRVADGEPLLGAKVLGMVEIMAVASNSAACEKGTADVDIRVGDIAELTSDDAETLRRKLSSGNSKRYAQVVTFTEDDPLTAEKREYIPRPPLPEGNRLNGSVSFEFGTIRDRTSSGSHSNQEDHCCPGKIFLGADNSRCIS